MRLEEWKKTVFGLVIQRAKKWNALNVVPMEVGDENVSTNVAAVEFGAQLLSQGTEAGATVEDVQVVADAYLDAGGITSIAQVFRVGSGS